jgi:hypothetical protein
VERVAELASFHSGRVDHSATTTAAPLATVITNDRRSAMSSTRRLGDEGDGDTFRNLRRDELGTHADS